MSHVHPLYSRAALPASQESLYTLKRPNSANGSAALAARSSLSASGLGRSGNRLIDSLYSTGPSANGMLKRPTSALHQSFVAWSRTADIDSMNCASSSYPPRPFSADMYRPGTRRTDPLPGRPVAHANSRWSLEATVALRECEEASADPDTSNTIDVIERVPLTPIPEERSNEPSVLEHHTFTTPLKAPAAPPPPIAADSVTLSTLPEVTASATPSSKKVNDLRDATRAARDDDPRASTSRALRLIPELQEGLSGTDAHSDKPSQQNFRTDDAEASNQKRVSAPSSLVVVCDSSTNEWTAQQGTSTLRSTADIGVDCAPLDVFKMKVLTTFVDFVQRDKYFEHLLEYLADHEYRERLEIALNQTARRNALYVAMTRPYIRWAETGLNPGEPDPPEPVDPELVALNTLQFRRNRDNIVLNEERERTSLSTALLGVLSADYQCVYVALEEEAVRRHWETVYEPERWAFVIGYISNFLSTILVTGFHIFKEWSLTGSEIERMEAWERVLAEERFFASMSTLKEERLATVQARHRDLIETDERLRFDAILYANAARQEAIQERLASLARVAEPNETASSDCESDHAVPPDDVVDA